MDKLYLDFDEHGLLTMFIEGDIDKFKNALKYENNKYFFGVEKRLIKDKNLIDKLKYEHISLIPKVDKINCNKKNKVESTDEEKYEVHGLPDDIIFDGKDFYSLVTLEWKDYAEGFTCLNTSYTRSTVMKIHEKSYFDISLMNEYLNDTILPKIFDVKYVENVSSYNAIYKIFNGTLDEMELPKETNIVNIRYENGKIVLEKPKTLIKIDIPENVKVINCPPKTMTAKENILYDIYFPSTVENLQSIMTVYNGQINSIIFDKNFNGKMKLRSLITNKQINFLQIPCNIELMKSIINIGYSEFVYVFDKNSKLTLTYKNKKELLDFLHYFISLDKKLDSKKSRKFIFDESFYKYVPGIEFKFDNEIWEYPLYEFKKKASLSDIDITLYGSKLSHGVQNKIKRMLNNNNVHFVIEKLEETKGQEHTEEKQETNKTTLIADDIIEEILSIDYFGFDKNDVKNKVNEILIKYNEDLANLKSGLSLQSEEGLYTELLIKLNLLKDGLYQKFEKNLVVYDMLDEVNILLSILNGEEVIINTSLEKDFYSLSNNILPFTNDKITNDLKSYLENEKQKLENYLLTGENKPYEDMDKFILSIRTYLNITLLSIRNYLNREEILDVIRDYTNMQMKINYKEPIKNYLSIVLLEIDKIKNEIFDINPTNLEVHNIIDKINIDYSSMKSNEIIKYVDSILMEIYGLYYKIKFNNISKLKKESYKMRLLK